MSNYKEVHFKLTEHEWTQLFRIFPANGERTAFFRQCAQEAIRVGPEGRFVKQVKRRIEEDRADD
jgi:hypothetical protein